MNRLLLILALLWPWQAGAQGFAGLGQRAEGFAVPQQGTPLNFPQDHGAHPAYRIEWWYVTANLRDASGQEYGVQWTLFRNALAPETRPGWQDPQIWMGHAALTTQNTHFYAEKLMRGGVGIADAQAAPFEAYIGDWALWGPDFNHLQMRASGAGFAYDLRLVAGEQPLVLHGLDGFSVKSADGQASYYYSQPFYTVEGQITHDGDVIPVSGQAWLDREWSSQPLSLTQDGWDWFSIHLEDGRKLMAFRLRDQTAPDFISGTLIGPSGETTVLSSDFSINPLMDKEEYPTLWRLHSAELGLDLTVRALNPDAQMDTRFSYWEGPVHVRGSHSGRGYLEMTGYSTSAPGR